MQNRKNQIMDLGKKLAFKCIDGDAKAPAAIKDAREQFIKAVEVRCIINDVENGPLKINQGDSSLCGPAAFMYCVAREKPDDFARYAFDLALTGTGSLGSLIVKPKQACLDAERLKVEKSWLSRERTITPADWVTLASLRDSTGPVSSMTRVTSDFGGMTHPDALAGWFRKTGWFRNVRNEARIGGHRDPLRHLLGINSLPLSYVCLLINANIMTRGVVFRMPTHWVVLGDGAGKGGGSNGNDGSVIRISTPGMTTLDSRGRPIMTVPKMEIPFQYQIMERVSCLPDSPACAFNNDPTASKRAELEKGKLNFKVYTWGRIGTIDAYNPGNVTVEKFQAAYFGYVAAAR
ncbi:MAG: hypothetical protein LBI92_08095 [Azoarcus sp.]|jgi:hypothetical protein|nr:hypothetical protein [Azoarcus sp.]